MAQLVPVLLLITCISAQKPDPKNVPPQNPVSKVSDVLFESRLNPPEAKVDGMLRILESNRISDVKVRRDLAEEILMAIGDIRNRYKKSLVPIAGEPVDTQAGYLSYAYGLKLDAVSLLSRAIRQMLLLDKGRARQIIIEFNGRLGIKTERCEEMLVADVSDFYGSVGAVAKSAFTKKEVDEGLRALFIAPWLENIESPTEIGPVLDLLKDYSVSPVERSLLFSAISRGIDRNFGDDRSFVYAMFRDSLGSKVYRLTTGSVDPDKDILRDAFRGFLSKNMGSRRCKENAVAENGELPRYMTEANLVFADKPFALKDVVSDDIGSGARIDRYWQSPASRKLSRSLQGLRSNQIGESVTAAFKLGEEWQARVSSFLDDLESWQATDGESEAVVFNQKCVLYRTLLPMIPDGPLKKDTARRYLRYLNGAGMQKDSFIEWYLHVNHLSNAEAKLFDELAPDFPNPTFRLKTQLRVLKL